MSKRRFEEKNPNHTNKKSEGCWSCNGEENEEKLCSGICITDKSSNHVRLCRCSKREGKDTCRHHDLQNGLDQPTMQISRQNNEVTYKMWVNGKWQKLEIDEERFLLYNKERIKKSFSENSKSQSDMQKLSVLRPILTERNEFNRRNIQLSADQLVTLAYNGFVADIGQKLKQIGTILQYSIILTRGYADWVYYMLQLGNLLDYFVCVVDTHGNVIFHDGSRFSLSKEVLTEDSTEMEKDRFCSELLGLLDKQTGTTDSEVLYIDDNIEKEWIRRENPENKQRILMHKLVPNGGGLLHVDVEHILDTYSSKEKLVGVFDFDHTLTRVHFYKIMAGVIKEFPDLTKVPGNRRIIGISQSSASSNQPPADSFQSSAESSQSSSSSSDTYTPRKLSEKEQKTLDFLNANVTFEGYENLTGWHFRREGDDILFYISGPSFNYIVRGEKRPRIRLSFDDFKTKVKRLFRDLPDDALYPEELNRAGHNYIIKNSKIADSYPLRTGSYQSSASSYQPPADSSQSYSQSSASSNQPPADSSQSYSQSSASSNQPPADSSQSNSAGAWVYHGNLSSLFSLDRPTRASEKKN